MKKLMFATALVASAAAFADGATALNANGFEGYQADATVGDAADPGGQNMYFLYQGDTDSSTVKAYGVGDNLVAPNITRPLFFQGTSNANYLELSTEGGILWRSINTLGSDGPEGGSTTNVLGAAKAIAETGTYLDTLVQFTPTEDGGAPELDGADKLAIWLNVDSNGVTNLMVRAAVIDIDQGAAPVATTFTITNKAVEAGHWYRLTVKAIPDIADGNGYPGFQIKLDGQLLMSDTCTMTSGSVEIMSGADYEDDVKNGAVFASLGGRDQNPGLQGVGFKGSGALDDIVWTEDDLFAVPAGIDFSLTWPAGLTAVSYSINGGEAVAISGSSPFAVPGLAADDVVTFIVANADGAQKTLTGTAGTDQGIDATSTTFTWADYLGEAVDGAYEIDDLAELKLFQKGVANTNELTTANTTFKLTANITLDAPWPGIGLQNGKDVYNTQQFDDEAFLGTFDGQNYTISGFQMVGGGLDYCGFFNSTYGATIQNLKIQYAGGLFAADTSANSSLESGGTFVGVAKNSTLRNLTTVAGTVSCDKGFGGIVGYLTSGTLVDSCTNNVNMTSLKPNKCGGIAMITQGGSAVTICNCQNNGSVAGSGEIGSAIGYIGLDVTISNFESTVAYKMFQHQGSTVTLQGTIKGNATVDSYSGQATPGLNFATVDGSVATFVADGALAAGNTYKVMHTATATYEFAAAGSISFDTNLIQAVTFAITAAQGLDAPTETTANGVVTFTVASAGGDDYVVEIDGSDVTITPQAGDLEALAEAGVDTNSVAAVNAALATEIGTTGIKAWEALFLGVAPTEAGLASFKIDSISFDADGKVVVTLPDGVDPKVGRGVTITIKLQSASDLGGSWTDVETAGGSDNKTFAPVTPGSGETKKFYKVVVEFAATPAQN